MIGRYFTALESRHIHYRRCGRGPVVVALHPSPMSSAAMLPLMQALEDRFTVLAPDTPGYGLSSADPKNPKSVADYADGLREWADALGLTRFALYGSATGAQIALEFARRYPERLAHLVLDNAAHFEEPERARILEAYFPDLSPRASGAHLAELWHFAREIYTFFPWFEQSSEARLRRELPPLEVIHHMALDTLRAGADYHRAYRAAFCNEHASRYAGLTVPTTLIRWQSSLLLRQIDALIAYGLPSCVRVADAGPDERFAVIRATLEVGEWQEAPTPCAAAKRFQPVRDGVLHVCLKTEGQGRPIIRLHAPCESMAADPFDTETPCLRVDLPLHGETQGNFEPSDLIGPVAEVARELGFIDAAVSSQSARWSAALVAELPGADSLPYEPWQRNDFDLAPRWDGTHFVAAWRIARERGLFAPAFAEPRKPTVDVQALNLDTLASRTLAALQAGNHYRSIMREA